MPGHASCGVSPLLHINLVQNHLWNESKDRLKNALSPGSSPRRSPSPSFEWDRSYSPPAKTVRLSKEAICSAEFSEDEEEEEEEWQGERMEVAGGTEGKVEDNANGRSLATLIRA